MPAGEEQLGIGRLCRKCGVRSDTLGNVCPGCGGPYEGRGGLLDRVPIFGGGSPDTANGVRLLVWAWFALILGAIVMLVERPVAGILILAAAFGLLVAAIGAANALN